MLHHAQIGGRQSIRLWNQKGAKKVQEGRINILEKKLREADATGHTNLLTAKLQGNRQRELREADVRGYTT